MPDARLCTPEQRQFVVMNLTSMPRTEIARQVGRSVSSVRHWCSRHNQSPRNQHLLTSGQAARSYGCSPQWLTELARLRRIPARREPGGRWWLFSVPALDRFFGGRCAQ